MTLDAGFWRLRGESRVRCCLARITAATCSAASGGNTGRISGGGDVFQRSRVSLLIHEPQTPTASPSFAVGIRRLYGRQRRCHGSCSSRRGVTECRLLRMHREQEHRLITWKQLIRPDGSSLSLKDGMPRTDALGAAGCEDQLNNHYLRIIRQCPAPLGDQRRRPAEPDPGHRRSR